MIRIVGLDADWDSHGLRKESKSAGETNAVKLRPAPERKQFVVVRCYAVMEYG